MTRLTAGEQEGRQRKTEQSGESVTATTVSQIRRVVDVFLFWWKDKLTRRLDNQLAAVFGFQTQALCHLPPGVLLELHSTAGSKINVPTSAFIRYMRRCANEY